MAEFEAIIELSTLDGTTGFRLDGAAAFDQSGSTVASAGDVNGDGFDDLIVGAWGADRNGDTSGSSYVVFGQAGGFAPSLDLATLDGTNGFRLDGVAAFDLSGNSVASAGDVNGDGFDDLIVGAYRADPNANSSAGSSYVVFGRAGGFAPSLELSALNGTDGFRLDGVAADDRSGKSVASAGDVNGDGFDDLIVGAAYADPNGSSSGSSYVVFGQAGGFAPSLDLSALDGTTGFRLDGVAAGDRSGFSVASAGDVNGDGFDDVIVGAPFADPNGIYAAGSSYVVFGKAGGFAPSLDLSALDGTTGFRLDGVASGNRSGFSVAAAGDVNGDGYDDLVVGAFVADPNGSSSGSSYVVFGRADGFAPSLDLSALHGTDGFSLDGAAVGDSSGRSVASAGDVNGDGFDDLVIGADGADPNGSLSGSSYVVFGRAPDAAVTRIGSAADQKIMGGAFGDTLSGLGGADDLRGGGGNDTLLGGLGGDLLDGGAGTDTASYRDASSGVIAKLGNPANNTGEAAGDSYASIENLKGSSFADRLVGNGSANLLAGGGGDDRLLGRAGDDVLRGASGDDVLVGNAGNDRLIGGGGNDVMRGGGGEDILRGGAGGDRLIGGAGDDMMRGGGGDDVMLGSGGNDRLFGGRGNDRIAGQNGNDRLVGNAGADLFVFQPNGDSDIVVDFQDDLDRLDFRAFGFASKASVLNLATQVGADVVFDLPGGATVELANFDINLLGAEDIVI